MSNYVSDCKTKFQSAVEAFHKEISSLRTGRATPALVEDIEADYYGTRTPIKHMAAIHVTGPTEISIQPWDKAAVKAIEKAIQESQLGINPVVDKDGIRLNLPKLNQERREQLCKLLKEKTEEARIEIRQEREEVLKKVQRDFDDSILREDERFRLRDQVQEQVDEFNKKIEDAGKAKEEEIMTV
jgi:ribosome recycling factor